ncbi:MAG: fatty acid--CoA ligase [Pseudomonadota bacterium]
MAFKKDKQTPSAYSYRLLIKDLLRFPLVFSGDQEIVYRDRIRYTYAVFAQRIARLANLLTLIGVKPGDTVAMMDWDSHRYLECYFAVPMMGAVLHTVNIRLSPDQVVYTINHAEDDVILVNTDFLPMIESVKDRFETDKKIILLSDAAPHPSSDLMIHGEYEDLLEKSGDRFDFPDFDENTVATVFYTTGTTGRPKGVYFSHRQLMLHIFGLISGLSGYKSQFTVQSDDVYMPMTPMFHVHAWGLPYMMTALGAKQVYPGKYDPEILLKLVGLEKVTFSHCVPTILHMLLNSPLINEIDVSGWKMVIGGSSLSKGLCRAAMERGINLVTGYGLSETCPVMTLALLKPHMLNWSMDEQIEVRCRTGLPTPLVHVEIVDPVGNPLPHDGLSVGEVVVRSPWLTQGYLKEPQLSEKLWRDGWLRTGDIGSFTEDEYLQVTDRINDVIKTGGEWVSSLELEDIISQHEAVSEAAVIGVPDDKWEERPMVLVVLKEAYREKVDENELRAFFVQAAEKGRIARYAVPHKILIVDVISKTSVGKLNKRSLRNQMGM